MNTERDQHDVHLDANLRRVAGSLGLPAAPDAARVRSWKAAKAAPAAESRQRGVLGSIGGFVMAKRNWVAGVAAVLAVGAAMWPFAGRSSVQARTIVESLRATTFDGVRLVLSNVEVKGVSAAGSIQLRFSKPLNMQQLIDDAEKCDSTVRAAYASLRVKTGKIAKLPEMDVEIEAASTAESTWVYGHASKFALDELRKALPPVAAMIEGGVLLNFGKIDLNEFLEPDVLGDVKEGLQEARGEGEKRSEKEKAAEVMVHKLLTGKATAENLKEIQAMLKEASLDAKVESQGNGRYLLTTRKIGEAIRAEEQRERGAGKGEEKGEGKGGKHLHIDDDADLRALDDAVIRVSYMESAGVEWVEVAELGEQHGSCRLEFTSGEIDPKLLDMTRLIQSGKTSVLNLDALKSMFGWGG